MKTVDKQTINKTNTKMFPYTMSQILSTYDVVCKLTDNPTDSDEAQNSLYKQGKLQNIPK